MFVLRQPDSRLVRQWRLRSILQARGLTHPLIERDRRAVILPIPGRAASRLRQDLSDTGFRLYYTL